MEKHEMDIISQLMEELKNAMGHSEDDFSERLGRPKPEVEVVKMAGKMPMGSDMPGSMDGDGDMDGDSDMPMDDSPEDKLKKRLLALRGA